MVSTTPPNRLLAALAPKDLARLQPHLERIVLTERETLSARGQRIEYAYFPEHGMVSLVADLDGALIEIGVIGNEGVVGATVLHGIDSYPAEAMVQLAGSALRIKVAELRKAARSLPIAKLLLRFTHALHIQVSQSAACNQRHTLPERLARWLLITRDRAELDEFPLTHE